MRYKNVNILLVDDDLVDVVGIKTALEESGVANPVYVASDGVIALEMLRGTGKTKLLPYPFLILLDLNMPRMNGIEFLKELRADKDFHDTIVFVLTTSNEDKDKIAAYEFNIAGYMLKSEVGEDFVRLISLLKEFKILIQFPVKSLQE